MHHAEPSWPGGAAGPLSTSHAAMRACAFGGSMFCGVCERRMQGQWVSHAPYYRFRFPAGYALASKLSHPRNVYLREDAFGDQVHD